MIRKLVHYSITFVFVLMFIAGPAGVGTALAEEMEPWVLPVRPGTVEGVGVLFEVTDSEYLNVSLVSTEMVAVYLSSFPSVIELRIEAADGAPAADLTLSGLVPGLEYHLYSDNLHNHAVMTADEAGILSWTQDLVDPHLVFIQTVPSTYTISLPDGGDCSSIGIWDEELMECKLTADLSDTIQIDSSGITLDGNGHTLALEEGSNGDAVAGVIIPGPQRSDTVGVTVKNLTIDGFANGIYLHNASNCEIRGNTIKNATNNGIELSPQNPNYGGGNTVTGNQILSAKYGIYNKHVKNTFQRNTILSTVYALDGKDLGTFYNNNLIDYEDPFFTSGDSSSNQSLYDTDYDPDLDLPNFGGNYWSSYDSPIEGCVNDNPLVDGFCDAAYEPVASNDRKAGVDLYPWTKHDGWLDIVISAPVDPIMFVDGGVTIEVSAHFKDLDESATHTAVEWDWGDGTTPSAAVVVSEENGEGDVSLAEHTYFATGVYEIKLTMKDELYLSTIEESYKYVVVYDPSAGFVTGGGSINSPLGAYVLDPELVGQATFGFISKFLRTRTGENDLSGSTVFEFHAADLRFTSISYNFLVVKNSKAIYRGLGLATIEGKTRECGFMLTAQDGEDVGEDDLFRIQIWDGWNGDPATGLIYDNQTGEAALEMTAGTVINDGGSIIIHTQSSSGK